MFLLLHMAQEEQLGLTHPETLRSMHGLAVVYFKLGKYDLAENLLIPCLSGRRQKLGTEVRVDMYHEWRLGRR